jgi:hypothetical protein
LKLRFWKTCNGCTLYCGRQRTWMFGIDCCSTRPVSVKILWGIPLDLVHCVITLWHITRLVSNCRVNSHYHPPSVHHHLINLIMGLVTWVGIMALLASPGCRFSAHDANPWLPKFIASSCTKRHIILLAGILTWMTRVFLVSLSGHRGHYLRN